MGIKIPSAAFVRVFICIRASMMRMIDQGWWTAESDFWQERRCLCLVSNLWDCPVSIRCQDLSDSHSLMSIACHLVRGQSEQRVPGTWAENAGHVCSQHVSTTSMKTNIWLSLSSDGLTETKLIGNTETCSSMLPLNIIISSQPDNYHNPHLRVRTSFKQLQRLREAAFQYEKWIYQMM